MLLKTSAIFSVVLASCGTFPKVPTAFVEATAITEEKPPEPGEALYRGKCYVAPADGGPAVEMPLDFCDGYTAFSADSMKEIADWMKRNCRGPK